MRKNPLPLLFLPLLLGAVSSCSSQGENPTAVPLRYGNLIGNRASDPYSRLGNLRFIKKSALARLAQDKENFLLLLHGSEDTCSCFTTWHETVFSPYVKRHRLLVYAITLEEFETDTEYYGIKRVLGYDTLCVFKEGALAYQACTDDQASSFVTSAPYFAEWMEKRTVNPKIFYVNEEILDSYYLGNEAFTIYFARETCGDCAYLQRTSLTQYIDTHSIVDKNFFIMDFDPYRPSRGDPDYDAKMAIYQEKKDKYGLSESEDNPAGFSTGAFPTVYYVQPDGENFTGDVIEAAGVFYNDTIKEGKVAATYFTKARYEEAKSSYLGYLDEKEVATKWLDELTLSTEGTRHDLLAPYEGKIFEALLDYSIGV
ncbi:MAG: hypothetical protein K6E59_00810 [Bacilli bacterium]|nr:hypothetical protein [Bacilli bacterium]